MEGIYGDYCFKKTSRFVRNETLSFELLYRSMTDIFPYTPRVQCILFALNSDCGFCHENGFFVLKVVVDELEEETQRVCTKIKLLHEKKFSVLLPCIETLDDIIDKVATNKPSGNREVNIWIDIARKEKCAKEQKLKKLNKKLEESAKYYTALEDVLIRYAECEVLWWLRVLPFYCA